MMDIIIVLGCSKVIGGQKNQKKRKITPYYHAYGRLTKATEVFRSIENLNKKIICSGGFGQAERMKDFLIKNGIPKKSIIEEPNSRNTIENCIYTYQIINQETEKDEKLNIHLVTDEYHIKRSIVIFDFFIERLSNKVNSFNSYGSKILAYLKEPSETDIQEIESAYISDTNIYKLYLQQSLNKYINWYPGNTILTNYV